MSSRLCVKNLPKGADDRRLREVFSRKGEVTDAKVIRTKDGKSRQFAFIGFRTNQEAEEAMKYFNNTYIDTCKITCEVARKIGDPDAPRPWSRHSLKKPEYDIKDKTNAGPVDVLLKSSKGQETSADVRGSKGSVANDPKFQEFLEVMQPRSKAKMWANDTSGTLDTAAKDSMVVTEKSEIPQKNVLVSENDSSYEDCSDEEMTNDLPSKDASEELQTESKRDNNMTDMDFFKSKIKKNWSDSESDDEDSGDQSDTSIDDEDSSDELDDADERSQLIDPKGNLNKNNNVNKDTHVKHTDLQEVEDPDNQERAFRSSSADGASSRRFRPSAVAPLRPSYGTNPACQHRDQRRQALPGAADETATSARQRSVFSHQRRSRRQTLGTDASDESVAGLFSRRYILLSKERNYGGSSNVCLKPRTSLA